MLLRLERISDGSFEWFCLDNARFFILSDELFEQSEADDDSDDVDDDVDEGDWDGDSDWDETEEDDEEEGEWDFRLCLWLVFSFSLW